MKKLGVLLSATLLSLISEFELSHLVLKLLRSVQFQHQRAMPIVGNLSEFPLPEVLLLIGQRTGRLRLLDIPEFGVLDIDISNGEVQTMRIGANTFIETLKMLDKLGAIILTQIGMFEFRLVPISLVAEGQALTTHDLAMKLVCHVDKQVAQQRLIAAAEQRHKLVVPQPEIWLEPELDQFFNLARPLLNASLPAYDLALHLQMETGLVQQNLDHLRLLGFIELVNGEPPIDEEKEAMQREELAHKSKNLTRLTDRIRTLSSRLPAI